MGSVNAFVPESARFVVEKLRELVPRPKTLPILIGADSEGRGGALRWMVVTLQRYPDYDDRYESGTCETCPMGMIPRAASPLPTLPTQVPVEGFDELNVAAFADWWDSQTDAQSAVDAVWGNAWGGVMGYTTKFTGRFEIAPKLDMDLYARLCALAGGEAGEGPGGYCQWEPTKDGSGLAWDQNEKFYKYVEWLQHILDAHLTPSGRVLSGAVEWQGEARGDRGTLSVHGGKVVVENRGVFDMKGRTVETAVSALRAIAEDARDGGDHVGEIAKLALDYLATGSTTRGRA